jgi:hypothetical protein
MAEGDQNGESPNAAPESEKGGGLRGILIAAGFTLLGGIIGVLGKGYYDLKLSIQNLPQNWKSRRRKSTPTSNWRRRNSN